ncbi:L-serine ammonia-lyase, iron-sulfur-dependent, subunit alpha [Lachnospiraceae bacterium 54-53]
MEQSVYESYIRILKKELIPALGCTEPIALAYAAARARETLGDFPEYMEVHCSGNIIKNVKGVRVPNAGGLKGVETAVILGALVGHPERKLEVLKQVTDEDRERLKALLDKKFCQCYLKEEVANLYLSVRAVKGDQTAEVTIENAHTNITAIKKNGCTIYEGKQGLEESNNDKSLLNIRDIVAFANAVRIEDIKDILDPQIYCNTAIADEGIKSPWGAGIGRILMAGNPSDIQKRAIARTAAGSDARMAGCPSPVVINSGSGNQGMTCSIPVIEYAKELGKNREELYRALCISNLAAQDQKRYIGPLSAYCGVVCAAAGAGAAITYLHGGTVEQIEHTVINTIANVGGMVCDGAKASCAAKISTALQAALLGHEMSMQGITFEAGEGLVQSEPEQTIRAFGHVGREGMRKTDIEILNIMIGNTKLE